jgi:rod shape-determining protein MreD
VRRAFLSAVLLAAAVVLQLTVVNRLPLPGAGPDLVLLAVVALGLCGRPAAGAVTGFCAGLALDLAPPGSYLVGEYALVFCVIGYLCGRLRGSLNQSALLTLAFAAAAAAAGEAASAGLGLVLSDPQVTWSAVRLVLPSSIVYDAVVTPFLLPAVMRAVRWADGLGRDASGERHADGAALLARTRAPGGTLRSRPALGGTVLGGAGLLGGAGWLAGPVGSGGSRGPRAYRRARNGAGVHVPRTPRLRVAAARPGDGWLGGGPRTGPTALAPRGPGRPGRPPRLRPASGSPGSAAARPPPALPRSSANLRIAPPRRRDGTVGRMLGPAARASLAGSALRGGGSGPPGSAFRSRRGSVGAVAGLSRSAPPARSPRFRPDPRLRGGSSSTEMLRGGGLSNGRLGGGALRGRAPHGSAFRGGAPQRMRSARGVTLQLGTGRRRDGVLSGGVLGGGRTVGLGGGLRGGAVRGGAPLRMRSARGVTLRLGTGRRRDGVLSGGVLGGGRTVGIGGGQRTGALRGGGLPGSALRGGAPRGRMHRILTARAAGLRLGSGRRGDGTLGGGVLTSRGLWARSRQATPRFRSRPAVGGRSLPGRRARLRAGRPARFSPGRASFLATLTHGRLGGRSTVWRIGSRRTGGLR